MTTHQRLLPFAEIPESFKGLKDDGIYYVDKTGFIPYLISQRRRICVFTRPRRFGKTLMLRTLQTFFEYALDDEGNPIGGRRCAQAHGAIPRHIAVVQRRVGGHV